MKTTIGSFALHLWVATGLLTSPALGDGPQAQPLGVFSGTGSNSCGAATVVPVPVGPVGSPLTVTIMGDNSGATLPDCRPPLGYHIGPVWWEAFQITSRANVTIDLCETSPVQEPSYDIIFSGCTVSPLMCPGPHPSSASDRGAPYCADGNIWSTFTNLDPGTYRVPILSDASVLQGGLGPYTMHIHAEACPGACCHTNEITCDDCVDPANCVGPGDEFHAGQSCLQVECASVIGPDLVVAVWGCEDLGREGPLGSGTVAMSCNTTACNKGDKRGNWIALPDTDHPVIGVNLYRMSSVAGASRFEQLGYSWLKHGFGSANADECGFGCVPGAPFEQIGVGCSDTYAAPQFDACGLGPRSMIHPYTGVMPEGPSLGENFDCGPFASTNENFPSNDHRGHVHTPISHKVQIQEVDIDPLLNPGARYFAEGFYLAPHEYTQGNGNQNNNVSHVEVGVSGPDIDGVYSYVDLELPSLESPALDAWNGASKSLIEPAPLEDGRAFLAWEVTDLGGGLWHYEIALYNMNLDRSLGSLCIPLAAGAMISNVGFHAPDHHAPEPNADNYSNDPWSSTVSAQAIRFETESYGQNPLANAVRFGTMYNIRFDADAPPQTINAGVGVFKTGQVVAAALQGPSPAVVDDNNGNGIADFCEPAIPTDPQVDPLDVNRSRFVSFTVSASLPDVGETALRVRLLSLHHVVPPYSGGPSIPFTAMEGQIRWVGPPAPYVESSSDPTSFQAAHLQCDPHYRDWSTVGLLHVTGSAIVPSSTYEVENVAASCMGMESTCIAVSAPLEIATTRWADVVAPFNPPDLSEQPDFSDVSALVDKFKSLPSAPIKARALLAGSDALGNINIAPDLGFNHIAACVDAFRGLPYPYTISGCP